MANRLAREKSPYLQQHKNNPVDWYAWGPEALDRARTEDKPILVSIGYSACHWCHVMEHESFENDETARLMNARFINVKVDREERPDVDSIYMEAVQALTGQGGWPLNVFLTPDGRPFFGGTYFPPLPRHGIPSWPQVLRSVSEAYRDRRDDVLHNAEALTRYIREAQDKAPSLEMPSTDTLRTVYGRIESQFDRTGGGFGGAPKFPQSMGLEFVLRMQRRFPEQGGREFVLLTLRNMAAGGIFDQLAGGFHRYTVDARWLVPHFEKMLYDNALLVPVYLHAFQITGDRQYARVAEQTLEYLLRDLLAPEGAFYAAEDADSEGEEGKFYVWTPEEFEQVLGPELSAIAAEHYGVRPTGNFEGKSILTLALGADQLVARSGRTAEEIQTMLQEAREQLLSARSRRVRPGLDTKILAAWNGLAIRALAEAACVLREPKYLAAAECAARFVLSNMRPGGALVRSYREGPGTIPAFLDDYAYLVEALTTLFEATHDLWYLQQAESMAGEMVERFWNQEAGVFYDAGRENELLVRPRNLFDNPTPSGNSAAAFGLLRLSALTRNQHHVELAESVFRATLELLPGAPLAFSYLLSALDFYHSTPLQIAIAAGPDASVAELAEAVWSRYLPNKVLAVGLGEEPTLLSGKREINGKPSAYLCEHFACGLPVTRAAEFARQLDGIATPSAGS